MEPPYSPTSETLPPKPRSGRRPRTSKKNVSKLDGVLESSPMLVPAEFSATESDLNSPMSVIHRGHDQHGNGMGVLPWVESQNANVDYSFDICRELRELRVSISPIVFLILLSRTSD